MPISFSDQSEARLKLVLSRYPDKRSALIPTLWLANREFGCLTKEVMEFVAKRLDIPEQWVINTATFYTLLKKRPTGRFHIQVCVNVACYLRGSDSIVDHLKKRLGIGFGEITPDGLFSLEGVQCLASCGSAPAIQVNDDYYEEMTPEKVDTLLDTLRKGGGV